jgi:P27 family predicted phage terminase small subunit
MAKLNSAKDYFELFAEEIELTQVNKELLQIMADGIWLYREAMRQIEKEGITIRDEKGTIKNHPALGTKDNAYKQVFAAAKLLGLKKEDAQKVLMNPLELLRKSQEANADG